ncbi:MAG: cysteine hydrolase [Actinobacteria bacterium]|nr:cysteine hydrolase [Actinomycetota bacterium]
MSKAIIAIDYINEIVHPDGKLSGKGYSDFVEEHDTLARVNELLKRGRSAGVLIVGVLLAFSPDYANHPSASPLLGGARPNGALLEGTWATEFIEGSGLGDASDHAITKRRVSAFHGTELDTLLRSSGVKHLYICGVATDLAVQSAVREAHDLDYQVTVVSDCCAAANADDHEQSIRMLQKIATIAEVQSLDF